MDVTTGRGQPEWRTLAVPGAGKRERRDVASQNPMTEALPSLSKRVRDGALWSVLSTLILRLANIGITAIVARILAPRDFGVFAVALTAYAIVSAVGQLGVASCLMRADLDADTMAPTLVTVSMVTNAVLASAMAIFAETIARALGSAAGAEAVRIMALALILEGIFAVPYGQLTRDFKQDKLFWANAISFVPATTILLFLAKSGDGALAFAWSRVATQLILGCVMVVFLPRVYWPGISRDSLSLLVKFGLPLAGANLVNYILLNVDYAFVGHLIGAVALGAYVLAFTVASWPAGLLGNVINTVSMPAFSRVKHDPELLKVAMGNALRAVSLIVMPMCSLMIALSQPLVLTLYGAKWASSAQVLSILALYGAISIICVLFANMLTSLGKAKFILLVQLVWLGALVPAMAIGVHRDGIAGAAYAHIVVIGPLVLPSYLLALRKTTGVHFTALVKAVLPALLAATVAAFAARGVAAHFSRPQLQLVAGTVAGGLVYVALAAPQGIAFLGQEHADRRGIRGFFRGYADVVRLLRDGRRTAPVVAAVPYHDRPADAPVIRSVGEQVASGRGSNATLRGSHVAAGDDTRAPWHDQNVRRADVRPPRPHPSAQRRWLTPVAGTSMETRMMRDGDPTLVLGLGGRADGPGNLWPEDLLAAEDRGADATAGLVSLGFIGAALRRSRRLWAVMAIAGLIIGSGLYLKSPPRYQAATTLLITVGPESQPGTAILDNQAIAQSRSVAVLALRKLGSPQDPGAFLSTYTAAVVTDRVLRITASASSSATAESIANVVATSFLSFRASLLDEQQQLQSAALDQQVNQEKQRVKSLDTQIREASGQAASSAQQSQLTSLRAQRDQAETQLSAIEDTASQSKASSQITTSSMISGSKVLDPASPLFHSRYKGLVLYGAAGFIIGLALGMGIVIIRAVTSDRLHRRDDIARALGAPIRLTVPAVSAARRLMGRRGLAAAEDREVQRVVAHLRRAVRTGSRRIATLAVVPVDDPEVAALSVASLAVSFARQGKRVVLADLCGRAPAGQLLGVKDPGVQQVTIDGVQLVVVIPDRTDVTPSGPLGTLPSENQSAAAGRMAAACDSADVLLSLVALDPTAGSDHLATWAIDAVVVVDAGRSWTRIQAVGEMIRLAGTHLVSAVLVGSEKTDKSLGIPRTLLADRDIAQDGDGQGPAAGSSDGSSVSGLISR